MLRMVPLPRVAATGCTHLVSVTKRSARTPEVGAANRLTCEIPLASRGGRVILCSTRRTDSGCRHVAGNSVVGPFRGLPSRQKGAELLDRIVVRQTICLRQLAEGDRAQEVAFGRFLANEKVTAGRLIEGWSERTASAVAGRHVLAIQDTSEINFKTKRGRRRGLGEIGKGVGRGVLVHAMVAVDADNGACLGLVAGSIYTRKGRVETPHTKRTLEDKESRRWIDTAAAAKPVLAQAASVTVVADRESDIYAEWA